MSPLPPSPPFALAEGLSREYLLHHRCCPVRHRSGGPAAVVVAVAPDTDADLVADALADIADAYGCPAVAERHSADQVERLIERLASHAEHALDLERIDPDRDGDPDLTADVRDLATQPPVVRYVNLLVREAYDAGASDLHLEATRAGLAARLRVDGVLSPAPEPPPGLHHAVVSRVKLLAELDIAERRRPQDGRIRVRLAARELDLRVSTVPTMYGESVVLRLLERGGRPVVLEDLGMPPAILAEVERLAARPHGMLLVTGPTGSGKTTTLYAALQTRPAAAEKIVTVEDPIEYQLTGVTQVPVHRQAGVTFGAALRSILRQDPDVVMIGEMRDAETAEIAVQAAMTGHLVFSTLHTNDAVSAIPRLLDLGVPEYLIAATIEGILAQRLVRRICDACRETFVPAPEDASRVAGRPIGRLTLWRGVGCAACRGTGYRGRTGVYELLVMTDALKDAVTRRAPRAELRAIATTDGLRPMLADGWDKVQAGVTTIAEVLRVIQH